MAKSERLLIDGGRKTWYKKKSIATAFLCIYTSMLKIRLRYRISKKYYYSDCKYIHIGIYLKSNTNHHTVTSISLQEKMILHILVH